MKYNPKKFNIEYIAKFESSTKENQIKVWIAQPLSFGCQRIDSFSIFPKPKNLYKDTQGNKILYFCFKDFKNFEIKMNIKTTLWKKKINLKENNLSINNKLFDRYLKSEEFLKQTPEIKKITYEITKGDESDLDKIKSIFNFIVYNFKYCYPVENRGVEKLNLKNLKGDCGEYSSLFVTMCRILKIPAKNNTGFVISPTYNKIIEHGWASAYLKLCDWIDFDTQYASTEKNKMENYFGQRSDYRITFTNGFNIPLKPSIPKTFKLDFWNNTGLPLKNNSAQTLQPIIFASKNNLKFKNSIKIKKP